MQAVTGRTSIPAWNLVLTFYVLALTSMAFRDFPFLLEMIGSSLKIWRSNGWFCIRFHFFIKTSFKVDIEGWYCVTKDNISFSFQECRLPLCELCTWWKVFYHSLWVASVNQAFFEIWVASLKNILMKHWQLIENQPLLRQIYKEPPIISYKRGSSLNDILLRIKGYKHEGGKRESGFSLSCDMLQIYRAINWLIIAR